MLHDEYLVTDSDMTIYNDEEISLPYRYNPRYYQTDLVDAFFDMLAGDSNIKNFIACWHRRAGKDVTFFQLIVAAAIMERGDYYYLMPAKNQAKRTIFNGNVMDSSGITCKFTDFIPPAQLQGTHTQDLEIHLTNGSRIIVGGSDNYDNFVGGNAKGVVYSEWSLTNPAARDLIEPMIKQNKGWSLFCFTPRGKNHAFDTLVTAQKEVNKHRWFVSLKTIEETRNERGEYVVSPEEIQYEIDNEGLDENIARQEYYLDFNARVKGVIYGKEMEAARAQGRVRVIEPDPTKPVLTFWDIGISRGNAMAIWCFQECGDELNAIAYFEAEDEPITYFLTNPNGGNEGVINAYIRYQSEELGAELKLGKIYFPHDGANREVIAGKKRHEELISFGYDVKVLPRTTSVDMGITQTKKIFNRFHFDERHCAVGLHHLERYKRRIHKDTGVAGSPIHDDSSNCADALRQLGQFMVMPEIQRSRDEVSRKHNIRLRRSNYDAGMTMAMNNNSYDAARC